MDVRDRLMAPPTGVRPSPDLAREVFARGRRRRTRRRAVVAAGPVAVFVLAVALIVPGGDGGGPLIEDGPGVASEPDAPVADPTAVEGIPDTSWVMTEGAGPLGAIESDPDPVTLRTTRITTPDDPLILLMVTGTGPCGTFRFPVRAVDGQLDVDTSVWSPEDTCPGSDQVPGGAYAAALDDVTAGEVVDGRLVLTGPDTRLVFDRDALDGGEVFEVGQVAFTVPSGVALEVASDTVGLPCHLGTAVPTVHALPDGIGPVDDGDCATEPATATSIVVAPQSQVPPAFLPGHGVPDEDRDVDDLELLGTAGTSESFERQDGTPVVTYAFPELDLFLEVRDPDAGDGTLLDELLASAERADEEVDAPPPSTPPLDDEASTADREQPPGASGDLVVTAVRVGVHDGFDRVTVELAGDGEAGWFANLRDQAQQAGSGDPVDVAGGAVLDLGVNMLTFPPEIPDGLEPWDGTTVTAPSDAGVVTEIVDDGWFEGQKQVFIGLTEPVPYRLVRLSSPQRIVIDLLHP